MKRTAQEESKAGRGPRTLFFFVGPRLKAVEKMGEVCVECLGVRELSWDGPTKGHEGVEKCRGARNGSG